jgi:FkbM family methyltransferase
MIFFLVCLLFLSIFSAEYKGIFYDEHTILNLVKTFLPDDPYILEAGAHHGEDTIKISATWPKAKIFAFEPLKTSFRKLHDATANLLNVQCYQYALSNINGKADFHICITGDGASSLLKPNSILDKWMIFTKQVIKVDTIILDHWAEINNVNKIDFMWLDMEGAELMVLKASPEILSKVKVIYTEVNYQEFREGNCFYKDINDYLLSQGFKEIWNHSWNVDEQSWQGNVLYVRN